MTRFFDRDPDSPERHSKRRKALFFASLLVGSTLMYVELVMRFSN
ncbi:MAG: hypothetical protein AAGK67_11740 [Pseudomonadota bacterium]